MTTDIHALLGAYVLDAVDDLERAAFERHLGDCETCRTEVAELREAAARLADGAWSVPPPGLRAQVMTAVANTRQARPDTPVRREHPARWRRYTAVAAAAVVLAGAAATVSWTVQDQRVLAEHARAIAAEQQQARVRQILAAADVVLHRSPLAGGGSVTVASSALNNAGVIMLGATAPPPDGRVFQLWKVRGTPESIVSLVAGQTSVVQIVDGLPGSDAVGVSVERAGGAAEPTTPLAATVMLT
jgi:hypothetical protein